jgi:hypothetical protein
MPFARKAVLPVGDVTPGGVEASPRLTLAHSTISEWQEARRAPDASDTILQERKFKWIATLPAEIRPMATGRRYPRIVNRIGDLWGHCEYSRLYFQSLLIDRRKGRKGFPPEVRRELEALQRYYFEHLSGLPEVLWNAVPVRPPRIPDVIIAPLPDATEIDIPPVLRIT